MRETTAHWVHEFEAIDLPCGPLQSIPQAAEHPQIVARQMLQPVESPRGNTLTIPQSPIRLSRTPGAIRGGPPKVGQHTREVLADLLGLDAAAIEAEFSKGAAVEGKDLPPELTE